MPLAPAGDVPCASDAYAHGSPSFCVNLPSEFRGKTPHVGPTYVLFDGEHETLSVSWAKVSDPQVASWRRAPSRGRDRTGALDLLARETLSTGTFHIVHDATQSTMLDLFKVPDLAGVTVVDDGSTAFRCSTTILLQGSENVRSIAASRGGFLGACKSLHAGARP